MAAPSHNYNTRYRQNRLAAQLNEEEEASQQPSMDSLDPNVFTFYKNKKKEKWWSVIVPFEKTKKNSITVKETCELFMKKIKKKPICIEAGSYGQAWIVKMDGKQKEYVQKIYRNTEDAEEIIYEINTLTSCYGEYIPKLIYSGFVFEEKFVNEKKISMIKWSTIMEYFKGGTIWHHLINGKIFTSDEIKFIAFELALALEYLHGKNYVHGDLKINNIVLTENGNVRLIDFGKSRCVEMEDIALPHQVNYYMAPEVYRRDKPGVASDRWCYAVVLCLLIQGGFPFGQVGQTDKEIYDDTINKEPKLKKINDVNAKDLIRKLLNPDPVQRYSEITKHAYFKGLKKDDDPPFKPGVLNLKHVDVGEDEIVSSTSFNFYIVELMEEALKIPTIPYFESLEKPTIVNKETRILPTRVKSTKLLNVKEMNIQVNAAKLTKSKGVEEVRKPEAVDVPANEKATNKKGGEKGKKRKAGVNGNNKKQAKKGKKEA